MMTEKKFVLVTTEYRGVFAGFLEDQDARTVILSRAKCAIRWNTEGGFLELAKKGPNDGSRVGSEADRITLYGVTGMADVTDEAREKWLA